MRACVHIYSMMSMHEEAVALALQVITLVLLQLNVTKFYLYFFSRFELCIYLVDSGMAVLKDLRSLLLAPVGLSKFTSIGFK